MYKLILSCFQACGLAAQTLWVESHAGSCVSIKPLRELSRGATAAAGTLVLATSTLVLVLALVLALALALVLVLATSTLVRAFALALQVRLFRSDVAGWMVGVFLQGVQVGLVGLLDFRIAASIALIVFSVFIDGAKPKIARLVANSAKDTDDRRQHGTKQYRRSLETGGEELSKLEPKLIWIYIYIYMYKPEAQKRPQTTHKGNDMIFVS